MVKPARDIRDTARNNFTLLRLILALMVVLGHFRVLPGLPSHGIFGFADFAVDAFFVVSGYLVCGSYDRQPNLAGFYIRRLFRVYPLYLVVLLGQAVAMLLLLPDGVADHWKLVFQYLAPNLFFATFMHYDLDGLLSGLHSPGINPSLWTLKIEVAFYLILPLLWYCTRRWKLWFMIAMYVASTLFAATALHYGSEVIARQLPGQLRFFMVGVGLYYYRHKINIAPLPALIAVAILFFICTLRHNMALMPIYPLCTGLLVFLFALRLPAVVLPVDISYGVYLIHGPFIQLSLLLGMYRDTPQFLLELLVCVMLLATSADYCIERPGIKLGHRLSPDRRDRLRGR